MEKQGGRAKNEAWETSIKKKSLGGNVQRAKAKPGDCGILATKGKSCMKQGDTLHQQHPMLLLPPQPHRNPGFHSLCRLLPDQMVGLEDLAEGWSSRWFITCQMLLLLLKSFCAHFKQLPSHLFSFYGGFAPCLKPLRNDLCQDVGNNHSNV